MPSSRVENESGSSSRPKRRVGLFGGSFDPIHRGHLYVAQRAFETFNLEKVFFIPAHRSPHKQDQESRSGEDRLAMVKLAIEGDPRFGVLDLELTRGGASYTVETLKILCEHPPLGAPGEVQLYFIVGSDSLMTFASWRDYREIASLAQLITVARSPGEAADARRALKGKLSPEAWQSLADHVLELPPHPASSTELRRRLAMDQDVDPWLPSGVFRYIQHRGLYGVPT